MKNKLLYLERKEPTIIGTLANVAGFEVMQYSFKRLGDKKVLKFYETQLLDDLINRGIIRDDASLYFYDIVELERYYDVIWYKTSQNAVEKVDSSIEEIDSFYERINGKENPEGNSWIIEKFNDISLRNSKQKIEKS